MTTMPRRTIELMGSSTKKTVRQSRLALPIPRRTTQTANKQDVPRRTQSSDRYSNYRTSHLPMPQSSVKKRSLSQTPRRILQTPTTPQTQRTPLTHSYLQSADKRGLTDDKLFIYQEASRITEYAIANGAPGFTPESKLRETPYKQLIGLISFIINKLTGNRLLIQGNFIDDIVKALNVLEYPYTINKSWLKTPTAGHAYNHVVVMIGWLLNLVEPPRLENMEELEDLERLDNLIVNEKYPTVQFQKLFLETVKEGFILWNTEQENLFEKLELDLAEEFITQSTGSAIKNFKDLDTHINLLENQIKDILKVLLPNTDMNEYMKLENDVKDKQKIIENIKEIIKQNNEEIEMERTNLQHEETILKSKEIEVEQLQTKIKGQSMTVYEFKRLVQDIFITKQAIDTEEAQIKKMEEQNMNEPVIISRLVKQKVEKISQFNQIIFSIAKDFGNYLPGFDPNKYALDHNDTNLLQKLDKLQDLAHKLKQQIDKITEEHKSKIVSIEVKLSKSKFDREQQEAKLKSTEEKSKLQINELKKTNEELQQQIAQTSSLILERKAQNECIDNEIIRMQALTETNNCATTEIQKEQQSIAQKYLEEQDAAIAIIENRIKETDQQIEKCRDYKENLVRENEALDKEIENALKDLNQ